MFSRIRHASEVLFHSSPKNLHEEPDIVFEEESSEISAASKRIGRYVEALIIVVAAGFVGAPLFARMFPSQGHMTTVVGVSSAVLALIFDRLIRHMDRDILQKMRIGEHVAPYFGHRITKVAKVMRG